MRRAKRYSLAPAMTAPLMAGTVFAQDYRVVRPLAQGGMGAVYVVEQLSTGRQRALKVMHPRLVHDPKNRARFAQEARVGAWIGSEHVVEVLAAGIDTPSGVPWIAMELLEGETLLMKIMREDRGRGMPMAQVRAVLGQLFKPLVAAHAKGIVHRDLKPENVFLLPVQRHDAPMTVKLLDFGIAKLNDLARPGHNSTEALGTPLWMAPEQNQHGEIGPPADVWAVGLLVYLMLTGRFYWRAANERNLEIAALLGEMLFNPLPSASSRAREYGCEDRIPPGFDAWFARCVVRDPAQRFPSATEMTRGAEGWLAALSPAEALAQVVVPPTARGGGVGVSSGVSRTVAMDATPGAPQGYTVQGQASPTLVMASPLAGAGPGWRPSAVPPGAAAGVRPRRSRWKVVLALLVLVGAAGGGWAWWWWYNGGHFGFDDPPPRRTRVTTTVTTPAQVPAQAPTHAPGVPHAPTHPLPSLPSVPGIPTVGDPPPMPGIPGHGRTGVPKTDAG